MSDIRPTLKDVYDAVSGLEQKIEAKLENVPNRREMRLTVALAVTVGSGVGSVVTALLTNLSPAQQVQTGVHFLVSLL